jgi:hypothetical protein
MTTKLQGPDLERAQILDRAIKVVMDRRVSEAKLLREQLG